jgi:hypothetical protein
MGALEASGQALLASLAGRTSFLCLSELGRASSILESTSSEPEILMASLSVSKQAFGTVAVSTSALPLGFSRGQDA